MSRLPSCSVFLVEDEALIRMMIYEMVQELGYSVSAEAGEINQAVALAGSAEFDLAILDVNVGGQLITPVAQVIRSRGLPMIFSTGYQASAIPPEFRDRPTLPKPFVIEALGRLIENAMRARDRNL